MRPDEDRSKAASDGAMGINACAERQNAKSLLRERIQRNLDEAQRLQHLHDALPEVLPPRADAALWNLLIGK